MALQPGAPIIPVAIKNTDWMMGKRTGVAYAGTIEIVLGGPIETGGKNEKDITHLLELTRSSIAEKLKIENDQE